MPLKDAVRLPFFRPLTQGDVEARPAYAVLHYTSHRPHQGLAGATPAEVLLGWPPTATRAVHPPRGSRGTPSSAPPLAVAFLDPEDARSSKRRSVWAHPCLDAGIGHWAAPPDSVDP